MRSMNASPASSPAKRLSRDSRISIPRVVSLGFGNRRQWESRKWPALPMKTRRVLAPMNNCWSWRISLNSEISSLEWSFMICEDPQPRLTWAHKWYWKVSKSRWTKRRCVLLTIKPVTSQKIIDLRWRRASYNWIWSMMAGGNLAFLMMLVPR